MQAHHLRAACGQGEPGLFYPSETPTFDTPRAGLYNTFAFYSLPQVASLREARTVINPFRSGKLSIHLRKYVGAGMNRSIR